VKDLIYICGHIAAWFFCWYTIGNFSFWQLVFTAILCFMAWVFHLTVGQTLKEVYIERKKNMEEDEFNVDLPSEPTDADLDTIESGDNKWVWDRDEIVFDDEEVFH
jgi:hypothetical protein